MGSGERKRCSNMAPVRTLRSLAWMKARKLPGVRCSTLNTACRSLLCLMIMPGRNCVAGIAIRKLSYELRNLGQRDGAVETGMPELHWQTYDFTCSPANLGIVSASAICGQ